MAFPARELAPVVPYQQQQRSLRLGERNRPLASLSLRAKNHAPSPGRATSENWAKRFKNAEFKEAAKEKEGGQRAPKRTDASNGRQLGFTWIYSSSFISKCCCFSRESNALYPILSAPAIIILECFLHRETANPRSLPQEVRHSRLSTHVIIY